MDTLQRVAKNTLVMFLANIVTLLLGFAYSAYTARYLGPDRYGIISFALALTSLFGFFTDFGLGSLTVREVARDNSLANKFVGNIVLIKLILAISTFALIVLVVNVLGYPDGTKWVVYIIASSVFVGAFNSIFSSIFQAFEKIEYVSIGAILNSALMLLGAFIALKWEFGVIGFAFIYLFSSLIVFIYNFSVLSWKFFKPKIYINMDFWKPTLKESYSFGLTGLFVSIYWWIAPVMLSYMKGNEAVGWYNAAFRLIIVLLILPTVLNMSLYPVMSQLYISAKDSLRLAYEKYFKYMAILGMPLGIGTTLLADKIINFLFGDAFASSATILRILVWSAVFLFISSAPSRLLESSNKQLTLTKITGLCALINIALNLIMISYYSYVGASIAAVITEFISMVLGYVASARVGYSLTRNNIYHLAKTVIAGLLMGAFIITFSHIYLLLLIPVSAAFYFLVLYFIKGFDENDIDVFKSALKVIGARSNK